jgi:hypothetical protein
MARVFQFKRTLTVDKAPTALAEGEIALGLGIDPPKMWVGTPSGVRELPRNRRGLIIFQSSPLPLEKTLRVPCDGSGGMVAPHDPPQRIA